MSEALFCDVWGEKNINCRNLQETQTLMRNPKPSDVDKVEDENPATGE